RQIQAPECKFEARLVLDVELELAGRCRQELALTKKRQRRLGEIACGSRASYRGSEARQEGFHAILAGTQVLQYLGKARIARCLVALRVRQLAASHREPREAHAREIVCGLERRFGFIEQRGRLRSL